VLTRLTETTLRHIGTSGKPSIVPCLTIRSARAPGASLPGIFEASFYLLLQGKKRLTFAGQDYIFRPGMCAAALVGLPFSSEVIEASADEPYIGLVLKLDAGIIASLLLDMPDPPTTLPAKTITVMQSDERTLDSLARLLSLLDTPSDVAVLAPQFEREFCYRLLQGPMGSQLRQMGGYGARLGQIRKAAEWIADHADQPMSIGRLAESVGMSVTSFHRHFKAITGYAPLSYQRYIRLLDARRQLAAGSGNVTSVAFATGYASASQFSREYKKCFGVAPSNDLVLLRPLA
jgi:AraC-like DNA-binding protein